MKKRKIAFLIHSISLGGAERVVTTLANGLVSSYEVTLITFINAPVFYEVDPRVRIIPCLEDIPPSTNVFQALASNYRLYKRISTTVKENRIELLIGFMTTANVLATWVGKANRIPVIISERTNPYRQNIPRIWLVLRALSYRYADCLVVQTEAIKKFFEGKIDKDKLIILPNPISKELTQKRILGKNSEKKNIILSVGRLTASKAHDLSIRTFAQIDYDEWELWIAGEGPEHEKLQELIDELNVKDHVKLLGLVRDTPSLYNSAKIFAFSSTYEGFPNALIEAMHYGLACVSTDCPTGPSELIRDGENGYLVPVNDVEEMAKKLEVLINDPDRIATFGEKAVLATEPFEERFVTAQWKELIDKLTVS